MGQTDGHTDSVVGNWTAKGRAPSNRDEAIGQGSWPANQSSDGCMWFLVVARVCVCLMTMLPLLRPRFCARFDAGRHCGQTEAVPGRTSAPSSGRPPGGHLASRPARPGRSLRRTIALRRLLRRKTVDTACSMEPRMEMMMMMMMMTTMRRPR